MPKTTPKLSPLWKFPNSGLKKSFDDENTDIIFVDTSDSARRLAAHKMVLSVACPFFYRMFQKNWEERAKKEISVPGGFHWEVFKSIISFLYGEEVEIEEDHLPELYSAADYLDLDALKVAINEGFEHWELENVENAMEFCIVARQQYENEPTSEIASKSYSVSLNYIAKHIENIVNQDSNITLLPKDIVIEVARSEEITAQEFDLHSFLSRWIHSQESLPHQELLDILSNVRYGTIPYDKLTEISCTEIYHNALCGRVMKLHNHLFDSNDILVNPQQFCSRDAQIPFPSTFIRHPMFDKDGSPWHEIIATYNGHPSATLVVAVENFSSFQITCLSMKNQSKELQIMPTVLQPSVNPSQSSKDPNLDWCHIILNANKVTVRFTSGTTAFHVVSPISPTITFHFNACLPWLVRVESATLYD